MYIMYIYILTYLKNPIHTIFGAFWSYFTKACTKAIFELNCGSSWHL